MFDEIGDQDDGSVTDRAWDLIVEKIGFVTPLLVIEQPDALTILDYRPTLTMFLTAAGFLILLISFVFIFFRADMVFVTGLWAIAVPGLVCTVFLFQGTIREAYYFNRTNDSYAFVRQFIHRREVIEGSMSQFTGAYVKTETNEDTSSYFVVLKQEGMFLTGVNEQTLREVVPMFNSFDQESRIADAISDFIRRDEARPDAVRA